MKIFLSALENNNARLDELGSMHYNLMSYYYIRAFIDGQMCQCHLILIRYCHQFIAPVKYRNNDIHIMIF